ncbi:hypothetical protein JHK85_001799 [Glycine max]|uniref:Uncharacterized protein n=1 Tax=Glycine soja TaxID=3848 RepID=A0A445M2Y9_GLYSO|nr:hypothetical protein JHK85_001799 [Glycine max]KAG5089139.1 hypothetical protein JHK86_001751 [Glycine max]RZC29916.1 hypothetical protein D0Y65_001504 [Glycine soja]
MAEEFVKGSVHQNGVAVITLNRPKGTDSHTTMIDGLVVARWGVGGIEAGGIEAEAAMLGQEEEEDLGWDDIEDLSSIDENKTRQQSGGGASKVDLRKRLSATEQEEDLSWDIEDDDDETVKAGNV